MNDYISKFIASIHPNCACGENETVEHYLLKCELYEDARQRLMHELYFRTGSVHLNLEVLLTDEKRDNSTAQILDVAILLSEFIKDTHRFEI